MAQHRAHLGEAAVFNHSAVCSVVPPLPLLPPPQARAEDEAKVSATNDSIKIEVIFLIFIG